MFFPGLSFDRCKTLGGDLMLTDARCEQWPVASASGLKLKKSALDATNMQHATCTSTNNSSSNANARK